MVCHSFWHSSVQHLPHLYPERLKSFQVLLFARRFLTLLVTLPLARVFVVCEELVSWVLTGSPSEPWGWLMCVQLEFFRHLLLCSSQTHSPGACTYSTLIEKLKMKLPNAQHSLKLFLPSCPECIKRIPDSKCSTSTRSPIPSHHISSAELSVWSAVEWLKAERVWSPLC